MAAGNPIPPFPDDIDRRDFGHYLAGLTDGEGYFGLKTRGNPKRPAAIYAISLRADDLPILRLVQSFLDCGIIDFVRRNPESRTFSPNEHDKYHFRVNRARDLALIVVPHFLAHPLRAKKARDFAIWRDGIELIHQVVSAAKQRRPGQRAGFVSPWTEDRLAHYFSLHDSLRATRRFNAPQVPLPAPPKHRFDPSLFDDLD